MQGIHTREQIAKIEAYSPGKPIEEVKREFGLTEVVKLASNENPFGFSPLAKKAMIHEMGETNRYPEVAAPLLAKKLAAKLDVGPERLFFSNGSDEISRILTRAYINAGDEVILGDVTFPRYITNVTIEGGIPVVVPLVHGVHDLEAMCKAITPKTKIIFIPNPNNPTGTIVGKNGLRDFIAQVPSHVLVVVDEAYYEYVSTDDYLQTLPLLDRFPNLIILRTFSKIYGLAGLRIGYGVMSSAIVRELLKTKEPFNVNRMAQAAALAALDDEDFVYMTKEKTRQGMARLKQICDELGLSYFPSQANFLLVDTGRPGKDIYGALLVRGIIVRPCGYPTTIRVTIGNDMEMSALEKALREIFSPV